MKNSALIVVIVLATGCGPRNTDFNPFDNEFRFHSTFEYADYDSIWGTCGYWNLTKKKDSLETYYQFYLDEDEIIAKGFDLVIDEIPILNRDNLHTEQEISAFLNQHPIDLPAVKQKLLKVNIKEIKIQSPVSSFMQIQLVDTRDSVYIADIMSFIRENKMVRRLSYFHGKPQLDVYDTLGI